MKLERTRKISKALICLVLCLAVMMSSSVFFLTGEAASFGGGKGTKSSPYLIKTATHLKNIGTIYTSNVYFKLSNNINLSGYTSGKGWTPISATKGSYVFRGTLDGNGKVISNLMVNRPNEFSAGLFADVSGATIKNLGIKIASGKSVKGGNTSGGLSGDSYNSTFTNCYVTGGTVEAVNQYVPSNNVGTTPLAGGLTGNSFSDTYTNCYSSANIVTTSSKNDTDGYLTPGWSGGLVGYLSGKSTVTSCYATGSVKSTYAAGGLIGQLGISATMSKSYATGKVSNTKSGNRGLIGGGLVGDLSGTVQNCYATGSVSSLGASVSAVGAFVGYGVGTFKNSYATGKVSTSLGFAGGFAGYAYSSAIASRAQITAKQRSSIEDTNASPYLCAQPRSLLPIASTASDDKTLTPMADDDFSGCYYDQTTTGQNYAALNDKNLIGVAGKTTTQMKVMSTFSGWNFSSIWTINEGNSYPNFSLTKIALSKSSLSLGLKATETLKVIYTPASTSTKKVTWSSSKPSVATVNSSGKVTAKKAGTATITAKVGGRQATCKVTVGEKSTYVTLRVGYTRAIQNGTKTTVDNQGTKPFIISGKTMLPLRFVAEKMGGKVTYTSDSQPIIMTYGNKKVEFKLGSSNMTVTTGSSKTTVKLDVPAQKRNGRTFIPLRAIGQALGFQVYYHADTALIIVSNPKMSTSVRNARISAGRAYITK